MLQPSMGRKQRNCEGQMEVTLNSQSASHSISHHYRDERRKVTPAGLDRAFLKEEQN